MSASALLGAAGTEIAVIVFVVLVVAILALIIATFRCGYKKCPANKIMVIHGNVGTKNGKPRPPVCMHGGVAFVFPFIQSCDFLDLTPMVIDIDHKITRGNEMDAIKKIARFTVAVSTQEGIMQTAAERLLGLQPNVIAELAKDIISGQVKLALVAKTNEEIEEKYDDFLQCLSLNVEREINKLGLTIINAAFMDAVDAV